jgi:hypothetical protein
MSTGLKVVLWIVGIVGGLFVLVIVAGYFFGRSMMGDIDAGKKFAENATHDECVDEFAKRAQACDGVKCMMSVSGFVGGCLAGAKGDIQQFCATIPALTDRTAAKTWGDEFCATHGIAADENKCSMASSAILGACNSAKSRR